MSFSKLAVAVFMIAGATTAAGAADLGRGGSKDPDVVGYYDTNGAKWTGLYIGAGIGAGAVVHDVEVDIWHKKNSENLSFDGIGGEGVFGTLQIGGDYQFGRSPFVVGAFADYDLHDFEAKLTAEDFGASLKLKNTWSVGGRVGYLTSSSTMIYALAAYSRADGSIKVSYDGKDIDLADHDVDGSPSFDGWTVGGGIETNLAGNWFLKGEYRFTQYGGDEVWNTGNSESGASAELTPSVHTARAVLAYRFPVGK